MEAYRGEKFSTEIVPGEVPEECAARLLSIDAELRHFLSPASNEGNLSVLCGRGFVIKGAGSRLTLLRREDLSYVVGLSEKDFRVTAVGAAPSSESFMHHFVYRTVPAKAILHFHHGGLLGKRLPHPSVPPLEYGSLRLAQAVSMQARRDRVIVLQKHGFLIWAESREELVSLLEKLLG